MSASSVTPPPATGGLLLSSFWSVTGVLVPMVLALICLPLLIAALGTERFGLLTLIWAAVGYFTLFDLGIARALTVKLAQLGSEGSPEELAAAWGSGCLLLLCLGVAAGAIVWVAAPAIVSVLGAEGEAGAGEALTALRIVACSLPVVLLSIGHISLLQASQLFAPLAAARLLMAIFMFAVPAAVLPFAPSLTMAAALLVLGRVGALVLLFFVGRARGLTRFGKPRSLYLRELLGFGGWVSVSSVVGPVMMYFDRFFVASLLGLKAAAFYATPQEILSRVSVIVDAFMAVVLPALASAGNAAQHARGLFVYGILLVALTVLPLLVFLALLAPELLDVWLGAEFAERSAWVVRLLCVGLMLNTLALVPLTSLHAAAKARSVALLHVAELLPYLLLLYLLCLGFGIEGAALAWVARAGVDMLALYFLASRARPELRRSSALVVASVLACAALLLAVLLSAPPASVRLLLAVLALSVAAVAAGLLFFKLRPLRASVAGES